MKKYIAAFTMALGLLAPLSMSSIAHADQFTTVVTENVSLGNGTAVLPSIDGSNDTVAEKMANELIKSTAQNLLQNGGVLEYRITMNRPSLLSLVLTVANHGQVTHKGLNLDLTSGKEFSLGEFFIDNDHLKSVIPSNSDVLFGEEGVYLRSSEGAAYDTLVPYAVVQRDMRIGNATRILQVARLTQNAAGKTLHMDQPGLVALKLDSNPSTGYGWELGSKHTNVTLVGKSFNMPHMTNNA